MVRILVDTMPKEPKDCPFSYYIRATDKTDCTLQHGLYFNRCLLECGMECRFLKTLIESYG